MSDPTERDPLGPFREFGAHCLAYSATRPEVRRYWLGDEGFLAYFEYRHPVLAPRGRRIAMGDPIVAPGRRSEILCRFIDMDARPTTFLQVTKSTVDALRPLSLHCGLLGSEFELDVGAFDLRLGGGALAGLRRLVHKASREGVRVAAGFGGGSIRSQVDEVSRAWLASHNGRELRILTRPLPNDAENEVRRFHAVRDGRLLGLCVFEPMWESGRLVGYYQNHLRYRPDVPHGTTDAMIVEGIRTLTGECIRRVSFGLVPFSVPAASGGGVPISGRLDRHLGRIRLMGRSVYNFAGNRFAKHRYRPRGTPSFVVHEGRAHAGEVLSVMSAIGLLRAMNVVRAVSGLLSPSPGGEASNQPSEPVASEG